MTTVALGSIARIFNGNSISQAEKDKHFRGAEGLPYIGTAEVGFDTVINYDSGVAIPPPHQSGFKLAKAGTPLVCAEGGSAGRKVGFLTKEAFFGNKLFAIEPSKNWDGKFLFYFSQSADFRDQFKDMTTGLIGGVSIKKFKEIRVPVIALDEQRRIVAVLDKAFAGIATATANAQKNLTNARALFESYLQSVFTERGADWIEEPITKNVRFIDYRGKTPPKREKGVRLITAKNVKMGFVRRTPEEFIDPAAYDDWMTRGFPKRGDVLFTTEAPLGNVAQLDTDEKVVIGQRLITMQPVPQKIDSTFLKYMLCSAPLQDAIRSHATGATVLGIKAKLLKTIPIFYPRTIAAQAEIVEKLDRIYDQVELLAELYRTKLAALSELRQSLLQKAFAGELT